MAYNPYYSQAWVNAVYNPDGTVQTPSPTPLTAAVCTRWDQALASLSSSVNVKDFGAQGDNASDDTASIQAALNSVATGGGTLVFPAGTYLLSSALTVKPAVVLRGMGDNVTVLKQTSTTAHCLAGTDVYAFGIHDMRLQGPGTGSGTGLYLDRSAFPATVSVRLRDMTITGFGANGIDISNPITSTFSQVWSKSNGGYGFYLHGVVGGAAGTSCALTGCFADLNTGSGFRIEAMTYCAFLGCASDRNAIGYDISGVGTQGISFTGCGSETQTLSGGGYSWKLDGVIGVTLSGCWVYDNPSIGIWVTGGARSINLTGCTENTPQVGATQFVKVDTGCKVTVTDIANTTANSYAANTTNVLNDGGGGTSTTGYAFFGDTLEMGAANNYVDNNLNIGYGGNGGGVNVLAIANSSSIPTTNPSDGGVLYVQNGQLKYRGSSGTVSTIANA